MKSHKDSNEVLPLRLACAPTITHNQDPPWSGAHPGPKTTHNNEKLLWYFFWQVVLQYGICFDKKVFL